jgi:hypothetical protein
MLIASMLAGEILSVKQAFKVKFDGQETKVSLELLKRLKLLVLLSSLIAAIALFSSRWLRLMSRL